jgi:hypothetical protein
MKLRTFFPRSFSRAFDELLNRKIHNGRILGKILSRLKRKIPKVSSLRLFQSKNTKSLV